MLLVASTSASARAACPVPRARARPALVPRCPRPTPSTLARSLKADAGPDSIHDWRGKQMQEAIDVYFKELWSKVRKRGGRGACDVGIGKERPGMGDVAGGALPERPPRRRELLRHPPPHSGLTTVSGSSHRGRVEGGRAGGAGQVRALLFFFTPPPPALPSPDPSR